MKFDPRTIIILKNFAMMNPSLQFKAGSILHTRSAPNKAVIAKAKIKDVIPCDFAIYDVARFISVMSLFDNPDLKFGDKFITISSDGRSARYALTSPAMIVTPPDREINMKDPDVVFSLSQEILTSIQKALAVMSLPEIVISSDGKSAIKLEAIKSNESSSDLFSIDVGHSEKVFKAIFLPENWKFLPGSYNVELMFRGFARFSTDEVEYYVPVEKDSELGVNNE
jgi:hypothetical protein